jgi:hypothetical protein
LYKQWGEREREREGVKENCLTREEVDINSGRRWVIKLRGLGAQDQTEESLSESPGDPSKPHLFLESISEKWAVRST